MKEYNIPKIVKIDMIDKVFEKHQTMRHFFECIENGSPEDLEEIRDILENDESRLNHLFIILHKRTSFI